MIPLTFICAFYQNPGMLREQQTIWRAYPDDLKAVFHAIVTDDCSPTSPAKPVIESTGIASFQAYRTLKDVRWNWLFCRNLGVSKASTEWVLLTDIDHVLPAETLRSIVTEELDRDAVYRFSRVDAPHVWPYALTECAPYKGHPNTWMMTRQMFAAIGGYDERFSGFYGSDGEFRDRVHSTAKRVVIRTDVLVRYPREILPDASTVTYGRKEPQDGENVPRIRAERALIPNWRPLNVTFPYERVA